MQLPLRRDCSRRRSAGCFGDEALAQCGDQAPRPCVAFLAADSAEVRSRCE